MAKCAKALAEMHESGATHNDVKPENFQIIDGKVIINDFDKALSTRLEDYANTDGETIDKDKLEKPVIDMLNGLTPDYRPPVPPKDQNYRTKMTENPSEFFKTIGEKSDVYAFGITMYQAINGDQIIIPASIRGSLPKDRENYSNAYDELPKETPYQKLAKQALHPDPAERPTMQEIADALNRLDSWQGKISEQLAHSRSNGKA